MIFFFISISISGYNQYNMFHHKVNNSFAYLKIIIHSPGASVRPLLAQASACASDKSQLAQAPALFWLNWRKRPLVP